MAKILSLEIEKEGLELPPPDKEKTAQELVSIVIHNIMYNYSKNGVKRQERKQYYKIVDLLEKATKAKQNSVELDDELVGFLRRCQNEALMAPNRLLQRVEELIEDIKDK
jgi:hypothetical protein